MRILRTLMLLLLGLIFAFAGYTKLIDMNAFELYLFRATPLSFDGATVAARLLVSLEWFIALGLLLRLRFRLVWWLALLSTLGFSVFLIQQWWDGNNANCHCFGEFLEMSAGESLLKNLAILLFLVFTYPVRAWVFKGGVALTAVLALAALALPAVISPPDILVKGRFDQSVYDQATLTDIIEADLLPDHFTVGRKVLCFYSVSCPFCKMASQRLSGLYEAKDLPLDRLKMVFGGATADPSEFIAETQSLEFEYTNLAKIPFLEVTHGRIPLILLVEDGLIKTSYNYRTMDDQVIVDFLQKEQ